MCPSFLSGHCINTPLTEAHALQVTVEDGVRIEPYAVVQPGSRLEAGGQLRAVRKSRSKLVPETKDPLAMLKQLGQRTTAKSKKAAQALQDLHR